MPPLAGHDDAGGAHQRVADPVAALHGLDDDASLLAVLGRPRRERFVQARVEPLAGWVDRFDPGTRESANQLAMHQLDPLGQALTVGGQRPCKAVEGGQNGAADLGLAAQQRVLAIPGGSLPVVVEVGAGPLRQLEVLVALALQVLDQLVEVTLDLLGRGLGALILRFGHGLRPFVVDDLGVHDLLLGGGAVRAGAVAGSGLLLGGGLVDLLGDLVERGLEGVGLGLDLLGVLRVQRLAELLDGGLDFGLRLLVDLSPSSESCFSAA